MKKYRNIPTAGYDSRKEYRRATHLKILLRAGEISDLREQVSFTLIPTQRHPETGRLLEKKCSYIADFVYVNSDGKTVVEDVKGDRTPVYRLKKKLMLFIHGIVIQEI